MIPKNMRVAIVSDNDGYWYVRQILSVTHDLTLDHKVYRCNKHLGGPFDTPFEAIAHLSKKEKRGKDRAAMKAALPKHRSTR